MKKLNPLISNLILVFICFYIIHNLYLLGVILIYKIPSSVLFTTLIFSFLYNGAILTGLILLRDKFVYEESGKALQKINLANLISLFRISSLPVIFILLLHIKEYPMLPVFLPYIFIIFLTDLIDGIIARHYHEITQIGKYVDASSDYLILIAISAIFIIFELIPFWFFILIIIRLLTFPLGMLAVSIMKKQIVYDISLLGKISIFLIMFIYAYELFCFLKIPFFMILRPYTEYAIGLVIVISLIEKILSIIKASKSSVSTS